jgi:hypothetical protein
MYKEVTTMVRQSYWVLLVRVVKEGIRGHSSLKQFFFEIALGLFSLREVRK